MIKFNPYAEYCINCNDALESCIIDAVVQAYIKGTMQKDDNTMITGYDCEYISFCTDFKGQFIIKELLQNIQEYLTEHDEAVAAKAIEEYKKANNPQSY